MQRGNSPHRATCAQDAGKRSADVHGQRLQVCVAFILNILNVRITIIIPEELDI